MNTFIIIVLSIIAIVLIIQLVLFPLLHWYLRGRISKYSSAEMSYSSNLELKLAVNAFRFHTMSPIYKKVLSELKTRGFKVLYLNKGEQLVVPNE